MASYTSSILQIIGNSVGLYIPGGHEKASFLRALYASAMVETKGPPAARHGTARNALCPATQSQEYGKNVVQIRYMLSVVWYVSCMYVCTYV